MDHLNQESTLNWAPAHYEIPTFKLVTYITDIPAEQGVRRSLPSATADDLVAKGQAKYA